MTRLRQQLPEPVGLVPTMGYLHEGHLSLARHAKTENCSVVVSIFVNPTQFAANEDFGKYPRNPKHDLAMLEGIGTDIVFKPSAPEMYHPDAETWVEVTKLTKRLEGAVRPTHFKGVTTVVAKLFNIVQPTRAYFGQKDIQQALVITKMAADLDMPLEVITLPTVREPDGLALSSRNVYLSAQQRQAGTVLYKALGLAKRLYDSGERNAEKMRQEMTALIKKEPLAESIDYVSVADAGTLEELDTIKTSTVVSLAVRFGRTRLIDNIVLK